MAFHVCLAAASCALSLGGGARSRPPPAFAFSPGGLLFPYHVGVAYELLSLRQIQSTTPLGGSSAGAIVAAAVACGVGEFEVRQGLDELLIDVRSGIKLNPALRRQLDRLLPDNCAQLAFAHSLTICYTQIFPWPKRHVVTEWSSKQDLIDCIAASCNWPFFFSRWPLVWCRGGLAIDGFFAVPRERFGCPPLPGDFWTIAITPLPRVQLPAFQGLSLIQPGCRDETALPLSDASWFQYAMKPADDATVARMIDIGKEHARRWLDDVRSTPPRL